MDQKEENLEIYDMRKREISNVSESLCLHSKIKKVSVCCQNKFWKQMVTVNIPLGTALHPQLTDFGLFQGILD